MASDAVGDAAVKLKAKSTDLFAVVTGEDPDVDTLVKIVSPSAENNVFMATSSGELQPLLRALTDAVCKGGKEGRGGGGLVSFNKTALIVFLVLF